LAESTWTSGLSSDLWVAVDPFAARPFRPIDSAFPQYHQIECDANAALAVASLPDSGGTVTAGPNASVSFSSDDVQFARFIMSYFGAWKANQEFYLNGQTPNYSSDAVVLTSLLSLWNAAHAPGATKVLKPWNPSDTNAAKDSVITWPNSCAGNLGNEAWYIAMLLSSMGDQSITINTGAKVIVPNTLGAAGASGVVSSSSTSLLVVGGLLAASAGGVYLYSRRHHMTFSQTLKSGWNRVRHPRRRKRR
jgi:hypothetical protein